MGAAKNLEDAINVACATDEPPLTGEEALASVTRFDRLQDLECLEAGQAAADLERRIKSGELPDGPTTIDQDSLDAAFLEFEDRTGGS